MVPRRLTAAAAAAGLLALVAMPGAAGADNRRVAISNYTWTDTEIEIDRGEHVSWYWVGPDLMHSVTGVGDAAGMDSDPQTNQPRHRLGDTFRLDFDQPGTYEFTCKLHSTVNGTVTVSSAPGDPVSEPDPVPQSAVDLRAPNVEGPTLFSTTAGRKGTPMRFSLNERARLSADYYRLRPGKRPRFAGWSAWRGAHVGYNSVRLGAAGKHFRAKPGKYRADVTFTDRAANTTRPIRLKFRIRAR